MITPRNRNEENEKFVKINFVLHITWRNLFALFTIIRNGIAPQSMAVESKVSFCPFCHCDLGTGVEIFGFFILAKC